MSTANARPMDIVKVEFDKFLPRIIAMGAKGIDVQRAARIALFTISQNEVLARCKPISLIRAFAEATTLGLEVGVAQEAAIVPYSGEAKFQPMFKGLIKLAMFGGTRIESISARVVHAGDLFDYDDGTANYVKHRPNDEAEGEFTHAFTIVRYRGGGTQFVVMRKKEIDAVRARSKMYAAKPALSAWSTDYEEMAKKTVIKRQCKVLPQSPAMVRAIAADDAAEYDGPTPPPFDSALEAEFSKSEPAEQTKSATEKLRDKVQELAAEVQEQDRTE